MTIKEYYKNYDTNKNYPIILNNNYDKTIDDFYNNCLREHLLIKTNVIAWHNMLVEYSKREDAIFWIRYYEGGTKVNSIGRNGKKIQRYNTRRACVTRFSDGFRYVFVSNYDAHEILNMVRLGVTPDVNEFADLMNTFQFPMHYDDGKSCEESDINAYPNIGNIKAGILTSEHLYLAHINGIKSEFIRDDDTYRVVDIQKNEGKRIYQRGKISDWKKDANTGHMIRNLSYSLTPEEKKLIKAHFLRFIDPLNYYVTPGKNDEENTVCLAIGEYENLNNYMSKQFDSLYGVSVMDSFRKEALIKTPVYLSVGDEVINITYGKKVAFSQKSSKSKKASIKSPTKNTKTKKINSKQTHKQKYKFNGKEYLGHRKIVKAVFDEYFKDYPSVDYQTLKHDFNMKTKFNNKDIIRIKSSLTPNELQKRVFVNSERTLSCGTTIMVSSQWSENDMPEFIKLANSLGYKIDLI